MTVARSPSVDDRASAEWDIRSGPKNYLALLGAQAASTVLTFASLWLATHFLGPIGYGGVAAFLAASWFAGQLALNWLCLSVTRHGCQEFAETGRVAVTFWTGLLLIGFVLIIVIGGSPWWLPPIAGWLHIPRAIYPLVSVYFFTFAIGCLVQQTLQSAKLPRVRGGLLAVERAQILLGLVVLALARRVSVLSVIELYIFASLTTSIGGFWWLVPLVRSHRRPDLRLLKRMLWFAFPLIPYSLTFYLSSGSLDTFYIIRYLSVADAGRYRVASQLTGTFLQLPFLAGSLVLPFIITLRVNQRHDTVNRFLGDFLPLLTLVWSLCCCLFAALGAQLVPIIFGPQFRASAAVLWPLMAAAALAGPDVMGYFQFNNARSATSVTAVASAAAACVNVGLDILLIPRYGLMGCAWGTVGAYAVNLLIVAALVQRTMSCRCGWTVQATVPALLGAAAATWLGNGIGTMMISLVAVAVIALMRRQTNLESVRTLGAISKSRPLLMSNVGVERN